MTLAEDNAEFFVIFENQDVKYAKGTVNGRKSDFYFPPTVNEFCVPLGPQAAVYWKILEIFGGLFYIILKKYFKIWCF